MRARLILAIVAGPFGILVYLCFTLVAYAYYPAAFNPRDNWLSDLGNVLLNPSVAVVYRTGAVLTGICVGLFFIGLGVIGRGRAGKVRVFFYLIQALGLVAALALVMTGIFSEGTHASHSLWSAVLYISFGTTTFLCGWTFRYLPSIPRSLGYLAYAITVIDWVMSAFNKTRFLEWIVVALMLAFVGAVSWQLIQEGRAPSAAIAPSMPPERAR